MIFLSHYLLLAVLAGAILFVGQNAASGDLLTREWDILGWSMTTSTAVIIAAVLIFVVLILEQCWWTYRLQILTYKPNPETAKGAGKAASGAVRFERFKSLFQLALVILGGIYAYYAIWGTSVESDDRWYMTGIAFFLLLVAIFVGFLSLAPLLSERIEFLQKEYQSSDYWTLRVRRKQWRKAWSVIRGHISIPVFLAIIELVLGVVLGAINQGYIQLPL